MFDQNEILIEEMLRSMNEKYILRGTYAGISNQHGVCRGNNVFRKQQEIFATMLPKLKRFTTETMI